MPFQPCREIDGAATLVAFGVLLRQAHVALLVDGVVEALIWHGSHRHSNLVGFGGAEHEVQGVGAAAAPAPYGDAAGIKIGSFSAKLFDGCGLVFSGQRTDRAVDDFAPLAALGRRRTAIIKADDDIAVLCQGAMKKAAAAIPVIEYRLGCGLAVNIYQNRIFAGGVEIL